MKALSSNAIQLLEAEYLKRDAYSRLVETPKDLFRRVAQTVAKAEAHWSSLDDVEYYQNEYYQMMSELEFLPNATTLKNAGLDKGQLTACFVLPVFDSIEAITKAIQQMSVIHQAGGGVGFSFSSIRPQNDPVQSTGGKASGPVSFIKLFDNATQVSPQSQRKWPVNMATLRVDHPDILDFVRAKSEQKIANFNFSVAIPSHFMRCLKKGTTYPLLNPRNGKIVKFLPAKEVFEEICHMAAQNGNPGLLFIDEVNRHNPTPQVGMIETSNSRGEQPLLPFETCNLGSINLSALVKDGGFDEERFEILIDLAVRFLDNTIEVNHYTISEVEKNTRANRKIGLGVMGFGEMLYQLGIPYDSPKARTYATTMMKLFLKRCRQASISLAKQRGSFPNYRGSLLEKLKIGPIRNATLTTIAPTDTISLLADTSRGIEPLNVLCSYFKNGQGKSNLKVNSVFLKKMQEEGLASPDLFEEIAEAKTIHGMKGIPKKYQDIFKIDSDIKINDQIRMKAIFQKYIDNGVNKTITLKTGSDWKKVYEIYMAAYELKCKSINISLEEAMTEKIPIDKQSAKKKNKRLENHVRTSHAPTMSGMA